MLLSALFLLLLLFVLIATTTVALATTATTSYCPASRPGADGAPPPSALHPQPVAHPLPVGSSQQAGNQAGPVAEVRELGFQPPSNPNFWALPTRALPTSVPPTIQVRPHAATSTTFGAQRGGCYTVVDITVAHISMSMTDDCVKYYLLLLSSSR